MMEKAEEEGWWRFVELCHDVPNAKMLDELFGLYLTPSEREAIAKRVLTIKLLLEGKQNQREMTQDIGVSISKITRGSNILKTTSQDLLTFLRGRMH